MAGFIDFSEKYEEQSIMKAFPYITDVTEDGRLVLSFELPAVTPSLATKTGKNSDFCSRRAQIDYDGNNHQDKSDNIINFPPIAKV